MRERSHLGGGENRIERQHARGKMTARERLLALLDEGTFEELDPFVTQRPEDADQAYLGDAVFTGHRGRDIRLRPRTAE